MRSCLSPHFRRAAGGRRRQEADDPFAVDDDGEQEVLRSDAQPPPIADPPSVVPAHQFIEFPFNRRMFFTDFFILVGRRALSGGAILRREIIHFDPPAWPVVRRLALRAQRAGAALLGTELIDPPVLFAVRVTGLRLFPVRTSDGSAGFIEREIGGL